MQISMTKKKKLKIAYTLKKKKEKKMNIALIRILQLFCYTTGDSATIVLL